MTPATPKYGLGQKVCYVDNHGRIQRGAVQYIKASWTRHDPLIIYSLGHPSYRNKRYHAVETDIFGLVPVSGGPDV